MSDDLLDKLSRALAEQHHGATAAPEAARARITRTLTDVRPRRRRWLSVGIPTLTLLGASTAWAAATGQLSPVVEQVAAIIAGPAEKRISQSPGELPPSREKRERAIEEHSSSLPHNTTQTTKEQSRTGETANRAPDEKTNAPDPRTLANERTRLDPSSQKPQATTRRGESPKPATKTKQASSSSKFDSNTAALHLYRRAHHSHFQSGNCQDAVIGYEQYLTAAPSGTFVLEAKYNRAVCLAKLGRTSEAKDALASFADGTFGNYRREKSRALIEALSAPLAEEASTEEPRLR